MQSAIVRDTDGNITLTADRIGDLYYVRETEKEAYAVTTKES